MFDATKRSSHNQVTCVVRLPPQPAPLPSHCRCEYYIRKPKAKLFTGSTYHHHHMRRPVISHSHFGGGQLIAYAYKILLCRDIYVLAFTINIYVQPRQLYVKQRTYLGWAHIYIYIYSNGANSSSTSVARA